jgi:arsenate reductase
MTVRIYHNPRCSKSRAALELLQEQGEEIDIVEYLNTPFSAAELTDLLEKLGLAPRDIMRNGEDIYKKLSLGDPSLSDETLIAHMVEHPILVERPIVVKGPKAAIARPLENVLKIL